MTLRTLGFPKQLEALSLFDSDVSIKQHAQYRAAKAGSPEAALALVTDLAVSTAKTSPSHRREVSR